MRIEDLQFPRDTRLLVVGAMGTGKTTLVTMLADVAAARGETLSVVHADPGQPIFGPPGAAARGRRQDGAWVVDALEALATLDALRHRLPLVTAIARLVRGAPSGPLIVDAPGVDRTEAAAELLHGLAEVSGARTALVLTRRDGPPAVLAALVARGISAVERRAHDDATPGTPAGRAQKRTASWDAFMQDAAPLRLPLDRLPIAGVQPRDWQGRQLGLLDADGATLTLGEAVRRDGRWLELRCPPVDVRRIAAVLVRDACRTLEGQLRTDSPEPALAD